jgi:uncharacterized protein (TIGR03086 family)
MGAEEDPTEAWNQAYDQVRRLTRDSEALQKPVNGPGGPVPLEQALGTLVSMDTHVHTWDLARSVGGDVRLDPGVVAFSMALLGPMDAMIRQPGFFDAKVEPPAGADEQTELLCFLGRQV